MKHGKNAFHSFRHSFEDACRNSDISKEIMDALQGHGEEGMSGRYGRGFFLKKLAEAMGRLQHPAQEKRGGMLPFQDGD